MRANSTHLRLRLVLLFLQLLVRVTFQATSADSTYYVGAVAEYHPVTEGTDSRFIANENAKNYVTIVKKASEYNADVVVFPENSLTATPDPPAISVGSVDDLPLPTYIPHPSKAEIPCGSSTSTVIEAVKTISCAARDHSVYVVVNLREKEDRTNDRPRLYNTNVVFDRAGAIVARYRKYNLFDEMELDVTASPEISTFTTDFNVTFGHFICFDILFPVPALTLVQKHNVTDILFTSHWFSELPYLIAIQAQSAWSYANDVNLLASGHNDPSTGSGGSGIYAGADGVLAETWFEKRSNALLVANVPKLVDGKRAPIDATTATIYNFSPAEIDTTRGPEAVTQQSLLRDDVSAYTTSVLEVATSNEIATTLCDRGLCCDFYAYATRSSLDPTAPANPAIRYHYRYRFAVFNGVRTFSNVTTGGIQVCSVISCTDDAQTSCNRRFADDVAVEHPTIFHSIVITANLSTRGNALHFPDTLTTSMRPLNVTDFIYASNTLNSTHANVNFTMTTPQSGLLTFAIYGRNFSADGLNVTTNDGGSSAASTSTSTSPTLILLVILLLILPRRLS